MGIVTVVVVIAMVAALVVMTAVVTVTPMAPVIVFMPVVVFSPVTIILGGNAYATGQDKQQRKQRTKFLHLMLLWNCGESFTCMLIWAMCQCNRLIQRPLCG